MYKLTTVALCALLCITLAGARAQERTPSDLVPPWSVTFTDVAERAGLRATSIYGGVDRKRFIIETNGAGVAFFDYDNDGWIDALVLSGVRLEDGTRQMETYAP